MPGPAGHNAVVLFFSMNRYMSVGGRRKSLPADIPEPSSCFCTERRQSRNIDSVTQRGHKQGVRQRRHENVIMTEKGESQMNHTTREQSRVLFLVSQLFSLFRNTCNCVFYPLLRQWNRQWNETIEILKGFNSEIHHQNVLTCSEWLSKMVC